MTLPDILSKRLNVLETEEVAALDFPEPELDELRREVLRIEGTFPGLDAEALRQHLAQGGFATTVQAIGSVFAGFSSAGHGDFLSRASDAEVRQYWTHLASMDRAMDRADELGEAVAPDGAAARPGDAPENVSADASGEAWQRRYGWEAAGGLTAGGVTEDEFLPARAERLNPR